MQHTAQPTLSSKTCHFDVNLIDNLRMRGLVVPLQLSRSSNNFITGALITLKSQISPKVVYIHVNLMHAYVGQKFVSSIIMRYSCTGKNI